jgi:hypothetical protein
MLPPLRTVHLAVEFVIGRLDLPDFRHQEFVLRFQVGTCGRRFRLG